MQFKDHHEKGARGSTVQRIEAALMDDIATGLLRPGERLDEVKLTERFGVSRTPIREALTRLTAQAILVPGAKRGVRVAEYSREELAQIFEAMHEIEATCARIAAQRLSLLSRSEIEAAQSACVAAAESGDMHAYLHANEAFHQTIYRATGNPYIAEIASDFRRRTGPFRAKKFASKDDLIASAKSHEALIASIFSEDSKAASDGMRAHMTESFLRTLEVN
ncbi:GntR family transcriptional regulator [Cognatiyoonia sp. IB215446]|uniref:GntR family transcriptional regulator n=1 Tax=Cognatiyoonia sp. IB215446 TaxID=3097355 RepID=UPI002A10F26A|nr:GntR family transcriptional regulator [Cognatiyoonia sp. IB215446]MDX8350231.1 GntR family transcriptional regulator [Cognatiyoonia sp. IB215446]